MAGCWEKLEGGQLRRWGVPGSGEGQLHQHHHHLLFRGCRRQELLIQYYTGCFLFLDFLQRAIMVCFFFYTKMTRNLIKAKWNVLNVHINHGRVTAFLNERRRIVKMFRLNYFNSKCNLCLCISRSDVSTTALGVKNALLHNKVFRWSLLSYTCWTMESGSFFILSFFRFDNSVTPH